jgi:single-strand DNA-binding protein
MGSVNKVILVGNLGADPELKYTPSNRPVANLNLATNEVFKDKAGQRQERTEWHRIVVWGEQAEHCQKYLKKGRSVYVEGRLQTRSWDDKATGQKRYTTEIVADRVTFLGGGEDGGGKREGGSAGAKGGWGDEGRSGPPDASDAPAPGPGPANDDDIPF